ncbi:hypothetical protein FACS18942_08090 [Planctomycetales bacterium]|nr:hypothetical protein FACS18942_08090 [Planctomycetales bacterium]GHT38274.1 hypothetical protein FACS189427_12260 [Planctomycetales bacterium]
MMAVLTREKAIKAIDRFKVVEVDVTEWGEVNPETGEPEKTTVFVRELSAGEKDWFEASMLAERRGKTKMNLFDMRARMAVLVCCDANRNAIFDANDVEWLTKKSVRPLTRIYNAAKELNEITDEDEEEMLKNAGKMPNGSSGTTLPSPSASQSEN